MSVWLVAAAVFALALVPCFAAAMRGPMSGRLVGLEALAVVEAMLFVVLARGLHQSFVYDLAIALALLSFGGGLTFARFLERWL